MPVAQEVAKVKAVVEEKVDGLVAVKKDETTLRVHPSTLESHIKAGWKKVV